MAKQLSVRDMDNIEFQRREWTVERVGWVLVALFIAAALAGLVGSGPLSETTAKSRDGSVEVEYERFVRHIGTTSMTITPGPSVVNEGKVRVFVARDLATGWRIQSVSPAPSTESGTDDWLIWEFDVLGDSPPPVKVLYRGDGFGRHAGAVRAGTGAELELWQWIYP